MNAAAGRDLTGVQLFMMGLLALAGVAALVIAATMEVRYSVDGLDAVSGTVLEAESIHRGRTGGRELRVMLRTADGPVELRQDLVGSYAYRLRRGDTVRAWVEQRPRNAEGSAAVRSVWQIERGGRMLMPVAEVQGERNVWRFLMFATGVVLLLTGLYYLGRALLQSGLIEISD